MSKDEKFQIGDIVEITNPFHNLYGRRMQVSGYKSNGRCILDYIDELNAEQVEAFVYNLKLVERRTKQTKVEEYACGGHTSEASTWNNEFMMGTSKHLTEDIMKAAEQSVNQFNNIIKENKMATEKITIEVDVKQLGLIGKTKKEKTPKIVCKIDGELMEFKNEEALKAFMWTSRCNEVIRYDLAGKVSVPFELTTTEVK